MPPKKEKTPEKGKGKEKANDVSEDEEEEEKLPRKRGRASSGVVYNTKEKDVRSAGYILLLSSIIVTIALTDKSGTIENVCGKFDGKNLEAVR